jgi:hypothetical protein
MGYNIVGLYWGGRDTRGKKYRSDNRGEDKRRDIQ